MIPKERLALAALNRVNYFGTLHVATARGVKEVAVGFGTTLLGGRLEVYFDDKLRVATDDVECFKLTARVFGWKVKGIHDTPEKVYKRIISTEARRKSAEMRAAAKAQDMADRLGGGWRRYTVPVPASTADHASYLSVVHRCIGGIDFSLRLIDHNKVVRCDRCGNVYTAHGEGTLKTIREFMADKLLEEQRKLVVLVDVFAVERGRLCFDVKDKKRKRREA